MAGDSKGEIYPDGAEGETRSARRPTPGRGPADAASEAATHALRAALTSQGEGKPWSCDALGVSAPEVLKAPHRTFFETDLEDVSVCRFHSAAFCQQQCFVVKTLHMPSGVFFFSFFNFNEVISALRKQKIMHQSQGRPENPRLHHPPGR